MLIMTVHDLLGAICTTLNYFGNTLAIYHHNWHKSFVCDLVHDSESIGNSHFLPVLPHVTFNIDPSQTVELSVLLSLAALLWLYLLLLCSEWQRGQASGQPLHIEYQIVFNFQNACDYASCPCIPTNNYIACFISYNNCTGTLLVLIYMCVL